MANLSFLDAIGEMQRRSAISGRPAEKNAMDKLLRENSIRRLTTRGVDAMNPVIQDYTPDVYNGPLQREVGEPVDAGSSFNQPSTPNAVETGLVSQNSANTVEGMVASMLGFQKGEHGYQPTPMGLLGIPGLITSPLTNVIGKGLQKGVRGIYDLVKGDLNANVSGNLGFNPGELGAQSTDAPNPGEPGAQSTDANPGEIGGQSIDPGLPTAMDAAVSNGEGAGAGGPTVLCGELYRQGKLDWQIYLADSAYGQTLSPEVMAGYQVWAIPLSHRMARSPLLSSIVSPFVKAWAYEMAYRMGKRSHGTVTGKIMSFFGEPICGLIGRSLEWHSIKLSQTH